MWFNERVDSVFCAVLALVSILKERHSSGERCVFAGPVVRVRFLGVGCESTG